MQSIHVKIHESASFFLHKAQKNQHGTQSFRMATATAVVMALGLLSPWAVFAQAADTLVLNAKVITVDDSFSIQQAVAVRDGRILAVGRNDVVKKLAGPKTRQIDAGGRTVIPGLIDNHAHFVRAAEKWNLELRLDHVTSRAEAVRMLKERAKTAPAGEWIVTFGGWAEAQFKDDQRSFTREELDALAPSHPVVMQTLYTHSVLNSAAMRSIGIDASTPDPANGKIEKDSNGQPTGRVTGAGAVAMVAEKVPLASAEQRLANARKVVQELNAMGITTFMDAGGRGMTPEHDVPYQKLAEQQQLNVRIFSQHALGQPKNAEEVDAMLAGLQAGQIPPSFRGNEWMDNVGYGELPYSGVYTTLLTPKGRPSDADLQQWKRMVQAIADKGLYLNVHAEMAEVISGMLDVYEEVNRTTPIRGLRWSLSHVDQLQPSHIERLRRLGMSVQLHSRPVVQGTLEHQAHGDTAWDMPPLRMVRDSGIPWGLGSDATAVNQGNPFYTLGFVVTGRALNGDKVIRQTLSRTEALVAHTRANALQVFRPTELGALMPGRFADLLILDRDYLTVPEKDIQSLKPLMTMVGGRIVYTAAPFKP